MADAGVLRAGDRLPWLEPYRPPSRRPSNRKAGIAALVGVTGLAGIATLLAVRIMPMPGAPAEPSAEVLLPPPSMIKDQPIASRLAVEASEMPVTEPATAAVADPTPHRARKMVRRLITAEPTRAAYGDVLSEQADGGTDVSDAAIAIASMSAPPADPPRPAVNASAQVVRGKTVQLGVFKTYRQADIAWRSAIRDYTYLVTMPKSIEPIRIRSKLYYRLQLGTPSRKHARQLCGNLKQIGRACTVA
jgi:hypothetical protein